MTSDDRSQMLPTRCRTSSCTTSITSTRPSIGTKSFDTSDYPGTSCRRHGSTTCWTSGCLEHLARASSSHLCRFPRGGPGSTAVGPADRPRRRRVSRRNRRVPGRVAADRRVCRDGRVRRGGTRAPTRSRGYQLAALVVNAVGAERAEAAQAAVIGRLLAAAPATRLVPTLPYSPGYCGMALTEQRTLFGLFAGHAIGVSLSAGCFMRPLKSVSGLIGLGPPEAVAQFGSPCERCDAPRCHMRRRAARVVMRNQPSRPAKCLVPGSGLQPPGLVRLRQRARPGARGAWSRTAPSSQLRSFLN